MKYVLPSLIFVILLAPFLVLADNHTSRFLVSIPGLSTNNGGPTNFDTYINAVYAMFISIAALLAVVKLIVAGVKYMFTDIVTQKSEAKKDIKGALLGLLIIIGAVLILNVINPNLTSFNLNVQSVPYVPPAKSTPIVNKTVAGETTTLELNTATSADVDAFVAGCLAKGGRPIPERSAGNTRNRLVCSKVADSETNRINTVLGDTSFTSDEGLMTLYRKNVLPHFVDSGLADGVFFAVTTDAPFVIVRDLCETGTGFTIVDQTISGQDLHVCKK